MAESSVSRLDNVASKWSTIFDLSTCVRKGLCPVTILRGQANDPLESHSLYYEQHGTGPEKIVFIMGLNSSSFSWQPQVEHFARASQFSILVFDNRGVGNSGTPRGPYTTAGMAEDTKVLLEYIGWTRNRNVHVVGVSLGGMIAQELATRIPEQILSLTLVVTSAGGRPWYNLPPWKGVASLTRLLTIKEPTVKVPIILDMLFPKLWLDSEATGDPRGRTCREVQTEQYLKRIAATTLQTPLGAISQMCAGLTHNVSASRLHEISIAIPKILIITGDEDSLVDPRNSRYLKEKMPNADFVQWENTGHAIHIQWPERFNTLIESVVRESREKVGLEDTDGNSHR